MPGAIAGQDDGAVYAFTTQATPEQVKEYYLSELKKLGWGLSSESTDSNRAIMLFFLQGDRAAGVSVFTLPDGLTLVMVSAA